MRGDWLYALGTVLQLIAFTRGVSVTTCGVALALYGLGVVVAHTAGWLR